MDPSAHFPLHARNDGLVPFSLAEVCRGFRHPVGTMGEYSAHAIPGARLIAYEFGGHFLVGQHEQVRAGLATFLGQMAVTER